MTCYISQQIAQHAEDSAESYCPECDEELSVVYGVGLGEYLECEHCGWHNAQDE